MTISEYMGNLELESMTVANEMACDAMLCDFYSSYAEEETSVASESVDLAFDDDDDVNYSEPATEAGFFKSLGTKFKSMLETIKGWFEKVANTIKGWITKFVERIKDKVAAAKAKKQAMTLAGIDADEKSASEAMAKKQKEIDDKIANLEKQRTTEKNSAKNQKINADIEKLKAQREELLTKVQATADKYAIERAKVYGQVVAAGLKQAESAFQIACKDQNTIKEIMLKIINTKVANGKTSDLVQDRIHANPVTGEYVDRGTTAALKKVDGADKMRKDLETMLERLNKVEDDVKAGVAKANDAFADFMDSTPSHVTMVKALQITKIKLPSSELTAKASFMAKNCQEYADETAKLARLFGDAPAEGSNEKDKRPEIAKALSAYSSVASKLVTIANAYLQIANKGELAAVASELA